MARPQGGGWAFRDPHSALTGTGLPQEGIWPGWWGALVLALLSACCVALGAPPPTLISSFLTCTVGGSGAGEHRGKCGYKRAWPPADKSSGRPPPASGVCRSQTSFVHPTCVAEGCTSGNGGEPASFLGDVAGVRGVAPRLGDAGPLRPTVKPTAGLVAEGKWVNIEPWASSRQSPGNPAPGSPKARTANPALVKTAIMSRVIKGCRILINNGITGPGKG